MEIEWKWLGATLLVEMVLAAKLAMKAAMILTIVSAVIALTLVVLVLTGRLPWFVRRWI